MKIKNAVYGLNRLKRELGRILSNETRRRISEARKGKSISDDQRDSISKTLKRKYLSGEIKAITPVLYGKDNPNWVDIDIQDVLIKIHKCYTLKKIAEFYNTSTVTVGSRLKLETGKTFLDWRHEYGIIGRLSNPRTC
jgi:AraC-like DNA-binding protein